MDVTPTYRAPHAWRVRIQTARVLHLHSVQLHHAGMKSTLDSSPHTDPDPAPGRGADGHAHAGDVRAGGAADPRPRRPAAPDHYPDHLRRRPAGAGRAQGRRQGLPAQGRVAGTAGGLHPRRGRRHQPRQELRRPLFLPQGHWPSSEDALPETCESPGRRSIGSSSLACLGRSNGSSSSPCRRFLQASVAWGHPCRHGTPAIPATAARRCRRSRCLRSPGTIRLP